MKKLEEIKHLRKLLSIALAATMPLSVSACSKKEVEVEPTTEEITTQANIEEPTEEVIEVTNETIDKIIEDYNTKSGENITKDDVFVEEFNQVTYLWNKEGEIYIYDYDFNKNNYPGYTYHNETYRDEMYALIKKDEDNYEPIAGLYSDGNEVHNVKITYFYNQTRYEASPNYISIENPTKEDLKNLKKGDEYLNPEENKELGLKNN